MTVSVEPTSVEPSTALEEAMGPLREAYGTGGHAADLVREASVRLQLGAAQWAFGDAGGPWTAGPEHVPALRRRSHRRRRPGPAGGTAEGLGAT
ncbi:DUF5682 family protein [Streptomyces shaanxiensis]